RPRRRTARAPGPPGRRRRHHRRRRRAGGRGAPGRRARGFARARARGGGRLRGAAGGDAVSAPLHVAAEVAEAIGRGGPVVALETRLAAHGFPAGEAAAVAVAAEQAVRATGAVPATVGVVGGLVRVGLAPDELERIARAGPAARKTGPRDLAAAAAQRALGATTVGGTLLAVRLAGIRVMATGGLEGDHRGFPAPPDVSADLLELARAPALVVSAGVKSLLDVAATAEALETLGVPVLGWRTDEMPRFYSARGGPPVSARVETAD